MNNKIREIAIKCGMKDYPTYGVNALQCEQDIEKFANAIIDECMTAIKQEASISSIQLVQNSEMFAMGLIAANGVIKRRFGIE